MLDIYERANKEKLIGILFPVFSMRRSNDLGIGDTHSVCQCIDWLSDYGINFLQMLPINMSGSDNSPYSAISSVALDFIYLDMLQIPELEEEDIDKARDTYDEGLMSASKVNYPIVRKVKSALLRLAYDRFKKNPHDLSNYEAFKKEEADWLEPYCKYRWLMEEAGGSEDWTTWPEKFSSSERALEYEIERNLDTDGEPIAVQEYYAWVQWHAFAQWKNVRKYADSAGVKLMGDVPIGVSNSSADVFFEPQWFKPGWYGGAPPETVFKDDAFTCKWGQNWGVPLYDWHALRNDKFSWWKRRISKLTDIFNMFRIDHILGFYRIYAFPWHPKRNAEFLPLNDFEAKKLTNGELPHFSPRNDDTMVNKAKNVLEGDEYIMAILEAAKDTEVIGEDLGCVPEYVRPHLTEIGIAGFKICHWEIDQQGDAIMPSDHPYCAFATYTTHDHPSLSAMWQEISNSCITNCEESQEKLRIICQFADIQLMKVSKPSKYSNKIKWSLIEALLKSNARYSALMITDILDTTERINIPGTVNSDNWSYRVDWNFESIPGIVSNEMEKLASTRRNLA